MARLPSRFVELVACVTGAIEGQPLEPALADKLNAEFPPDGDLVDELQRLCREGREQGWLCAREAGGIKFGRPVKPGPATHGFSVDVVEMDSIVGPHHSHPQGEIDLVMPDEQGAAFDGVAVGWQVYPPGSAHHPTVTGGRAMVLYLLPEGAIEFTQTEARASPNERRQRLGQASDLAASIDPAAPDAGQAHATIGVNGAG